MEKEFKNARLGVFCCDHVFKGERQTLLVVRQGGDWQFLCGDIDHYDPDGPHYVCVGCVLSADPTLHQIADLPAEWEAERSEVGAEWLRTKGMQ